MKTILGLTLIAAMAIVPELAGPAFVGYVAGIYAEYTHQTGN